MKILKKIFSPMQDHDFPPMTREEFRKELKTLFLRQTAVLTPLLLLYIWATFQKSEHLQILLLMISFIAVVFLPRRFITQRVLSRRIRSLYPDSSKMSPLTASAIFYFPPLFFPLAAFLFFAKSSKKKESPSIFRYPGRTSLAVIFIFFALNRTDRLPAGFSYWTVPPVPGHIFAMWKDFDRSKRLRDSMKSEKAEPFSPDRIHSIVELNLLFLLAVAETVQMREDKKFQRDNDALLYMTKKLTMLTDRFEDEGPLLLKFNPLYLFSPILSLEAVSMSLMDSGLNIFFRDQYVSVIEKKLEVVHKPNSDQAQQPSLDFFYLSKTFKANERAKATPLGRFLGKPLNTTTKERTASSSP